MADLFDTIETLWFPARFEIDGRVHRNPIRKLAFSPHQREVTLSGYQKGRTIGQIATSADGHGTFISPNRTTATANCDEVLHVPGGDNPAGIEEHISGQAVRWLLPKALAPGEEDIIAAQQRCEGIASCWPEKFVLSEESTMPDGGRRPGLRIPQVGAVHAALAHWSVTEEPATIVMPTGTGKTETMLALLACTGIPRLMVVVPNSALRDQIAQTILTLGVLKTCGCLDSSAELPVVAALHHRPVTTGKVDEIFLRANVIVSTIQVAGQCEPGVQNRMAELTSHLFIDEAHHIAAKTWQGFRRRFDGKPVLQFTATPFRTDGKRVDGKFIYTYPLEKAQREHYFKPINFMPVTQYDRAGADFEIAQQAGAQLKNDLEAGFDHVAMARAENIARAEAIHEIYATRFPEFAPALIHSKTPVAERREIMRRLNARESRMIICVDMFGEGFDFPELKVAALHDRHKSLAITLQFVGRFTRDRSDIGDATVVANIADEGISNALKTLYAEDADWNFLLRMLSEGQTERARKRNKVLMGFTGSLHEIPLQTLFPRMSAVVYRTQCESWNPSAIEDAFSGVRLHAGPVINPEYKLAIFVTRDEDRVRWGSVKQIQNVTWNLYVLHWDEERGLLFINSSKPKEFHEGVAKAVTGSSERVAGEQVFRILHAINRLTLTNLGLSHALGRNIRYTMFMGADIGQGLTQSAQLNRKKSNLFGMGYEGDEKVNVGCSYKGRLWSHKVAFDLSEWVDWCRHVGGKLLDDNISTATVFDNLIIARRITVRPELTPVMIAWPEGFLEQQEEAVEIDIGQAGVPFYECDIDVEAHKDSGPIRFVVSASDQSATFEIELSEEAAKFQQVGGDAAYATIKGRKKPLTEWFNSDPPIVHFANGDFLVFNELFELPHGKDRRTFDVAKIDAWDWTDIDIRTESQGLEKNPQSVQRHVIENVLEGSFGDTDVVFDDDGKSEAADIVALNRSGRKLVVHLIHCKFSKADQAGARLDDLYQVCGQAQKCIRWREQPRKLLKHLLHRENRRTERSQPSRIEKGTVEDIQSLLNGVRDLDVEYYVYIVQPGLSKRRVAQEHSDLLGATEDFLMQTYSMPLQVIASA